MCVNEKGIVYLGAFRWLVDYASHNEMFGLFVIIITHKMAIWLIPNGFTSIELASFELSIRFRSLFEFGFVFSYNHGQWVNKIKRHYQIKGFDIANIFFLWS